ncbi:MAG: arylsulfatase [Sphingomonadales bacterium]|nr:arylsulfatase [Sphingomonadales bacterium]
MTRKLLLTMTALATFATTAHAQDAQPYQGTIGRTLAESKEWWPQPVQPAATAPNVVWILLDDVGFGASGTFGGGIPTPVLDSLANQGLRYTNFHTTAICAPTRAALLTGRNSSSVHVAGFSHTMMSAGFPGWDGRIPSEDGTVAEVLREAGYGTFGVGKYGVTPDEESSDAGPFDHWPTGKGFDHFLGFLGSQTDQYKPDLIEDNAHAKPDGRHLSEQITDKAIAYIDRFHKAAPTRPFFLYYAPGATHAPHQVAHEWSDAFKGKFDAGWDVFREQVFVQQKKLGMIPATAVLPARHPDIKAWASLSPDEKKLYARFMEVYAGYLAYTDHEIGRLVDHLKATGQYDNTLFMVMIGDNGASKEGTLYGDIDVSPAAKPAPEADAIAHNLAKIGEIGTPTSVQGNYPLGWAQAANVPFRFWKADANSEGGTRNPLIITWPKGIKGDGSVRTQYGHVIDILPTTLELAGLKAPAKIRAVPQAPIEGTSLAYSITDAKAASRHRVQYYYVFGARAIYADGWKASLPFPTSFTPTNNRPPPTFDENAWELYDLDHDYTERVNLAKKYPAKLAEMRSLFESEARAHNLYPLITWDDVNKGRIHCIDRCKSLEERVKELTQAAPK